MDFRIVAGGAATLAGQISGIFGSQSDGIVDLLHIQMLMMQNLSSKLDALKKELDIIVENILSLSAKVDELPARTAATFYKVDIQGRMLDIDQLIDAYREESQIGTTASINIILESIRSAYVEFRGSRSRILLLFPTNPQDEDMLVIPIVALCMHYEFICLLLTKQPASLRRLTLKSYTEYFNKWLIGPGQLVEKCRNLRKGRQTILIAKRNEKIIAKCVSVGEKEGEPGIANFYTYTLKIGQFHNVISIDNNDQDVAGGRELIQRGILSEDDLPMSITILPASAINYFRFEISDGKETPRQAGILDAPIVLSDGTVYSETYRSLYNGPNCIDNADPVPPIDPGFDALKMTLDGGGRLIVCIASMVDIASKSVESIDSITAPSQNTTTVSPFSTDTEYLLRRLYERSKSWSDLLTRRAKDADADSRTKLAEIGTEWLEIQSNSRQIMKDFLAAEERVRESLDPDLLTEASKLLAPLGRAASDALADLDAAQRRLVHDVEWNLRKAMSDTVDEVDRAGHNVEVAISAAFTMLEAEARSFKNRAEMGVQRMSEGRLVDAIWETCFIRQLQASSDNFGEAVLKSSLIKDLAMAGASIYGGPQGTAAFTAWYTYKVTGGDLNAALKAGIIAGLSAQGVVLSKGIPYTDLLKKTLATAAIGGTAVAASGGNEGAIIKGFLTGTAMSLASAYYESQVKSEMDGRVATDGPIDKFDEANKDKYLVITDENGKPLIFNDGTTHIDTNNIDPSVCQLGIATKTTLGAMESQGVTDILFSENAIPMQALARGVPMANAMARFHDRWCDVLQIQNTAITAITIIPASILTVGASQLPLLNLILNTLNSDAALPMTRGVDGFLTLASESKSFGIAASKLPVTQQPVER